MPASLTGKHVGLATNFTGWTNTGKGRLSFCRAKVTKTAKSRSDGMIIDQPFMAGTGFRQIKKSREGRQEDGWPSALVAVCKDPKAVWGGRTRAERGRPRPQQCPDCNAPSPIRCRTVWPRGCARGRARSPAKSQPCGEWQFELNEWGNGSENPKGISSFSPALTRSGYAGW